MTTLANFKPVMDALARIQKDATISHDNGTSGQEYLMYYWGDEQVTDKVRTALERDAAKAYLSQDLVRAQTLKHQIAALPAPKTNIIFKLVNPIPRLVGTKLQHDGDKAMSPVMLNVEYVYIPEDAVKMDLCSFTETDQNLYDSQGRPSVIIKLKLESGLLEVAAGFQNWKEEVVRESRCYVSPISYRSMQAAGKVLAQERKNKIARYGYDFI